MSLRFHLGLFASLTMAMTVISVTPARAIDVQCIEASKYKYLYEIFGNDRRRFSEFFQLDDAPLPDGEMCRAVLVTGRIISPAEASRAGQVNDLEKLLTAISDNQGWLATIYLASQGGNVAS